MAKTLQVIDPFFIAELGDMFELNENGGYSLEKNEEFYKIADDKTSKVQSSCSSTFVISAEYAEKLVKDGYLEEMSENKSDNREFVNVFDEINSLIEKYKYDLSKIADEDAPMCVKVEKQTVLNNLITVLNHLKDLKK